MKTSTRDHIIHTASELFYEKGYDLTGINEIIDEAGIAKATLYNHFKSKEELLIAYLDKREESGIKALREYVSKKPKGDARLIGVVEFLIPFYNQENFNGCWCIRTVAEITDANEEVRDQILSNKNRLMELIYELVIDNKPRLTEEDASLLSRRIYLLYEAAVTESHLQKDDWPIHDSIEMLRMILIS